MHESYKILVDALRNYVNKNNFSGILLGLSGGIDSALSLVIAADAIGGDKVHSVMMPSEYTTQGSIDDAEECAARSQIKHDVIPISEFYPPVLKSVANILGEDLKGITQENIQARVRAVILMTISNQTNKMVLATGNKSELYTGYCTLYGDTCGGYAILKDVYKTEVYKLSKWRNQNIIEDSLNQRLDVIPESVIAKEPSAELKHNQKDRDDLPDYDTLDQILAMLEKKVPIQNMLEAGYTSNMVNRVMALFKSSEYKRKQLPDGPKIS